MQKNVLVTGAAGFIGANLVRRLLKEKYRVHIILKPDTNPWRLKDITTDIQIHNVELSSKNTLKKTLQTINPFAIFHLAAHGAYSFQTNAEEMIKINIEGTFNLLSASKSIDYTIFVNTGSSSEYGFKKKPMKEKDVLLPTSFYAATKASATHLCQVFAKEYNKPVVTIRPFSVYGSYEEGKRFIPTIIKSLLTNQTINITPGIERRDFIYIDDMIDAYISTIKKGGILKGKICNVGTGKQYSNDEVVKTLFKSVNKKVPIEKGTYPKRTWDSSYWVANISYSKRILDWYPKYSLDMGLLKTYKWFKRYLNL